MVFIYANNNKKSYLYVRAFYALSLYGLAPFTVFVCDLLIANCSLPVELLCLTLSESQLALLLPVAAISHWTSIVS